MNNILSRKNINTFKSNLNLQLKTIFKTTPGLVAFLLIFAYMLILTHINIFFDIPEGGISSIEDSYVNESVPMLMFVMSSMALSFYCALLVPVVLITQYKSGFISRIGTLRISWSEHVLQTFISLVIILYSIYVSTLLIDYCFWQLYYGFRVEVSVVYGMLCNMIVAFIALLFIIPMMMFIVNLCRYSWLTLLLTGVGFFLSMMLTNKYLIEGYGIGDNWQFWKYTQDINWLIILDGVYLSLSPVLFTEKIMFNSFFLETTHWYNYSYFVLYAITTCPLFMWLNIKFFNFA